MGERDDAAVLSALAAPSLPSSDGAPAEDLELMLREPSAAAWRASAANWRAAAPRAILCVGGNRAERRLFSHAHAFRGCERSSSPHWLSCLFVLPSFVVLCVMGLQAALFCRMVFALPEAQTRS